MIVLDSDHLSELQHLDSQRRARLIKRIERQRDRTVATTIVSVEEQLRGRLATINKRPPGNEQVVPYQELIGLLEFCSCWIVLPFDHVSARQFHDLKAARIRIGTMDLKNDGRRTPSLNACTGLERFEIREDLPNASASKTSKTQFWRFWGHHPRG
jgi:tRNA(fMet)-specific endonuclease VapC